MNAPTRRRPTLYVVAVSHLDSQWRWTLRRTVAQFLPRTIAENRRAFARFPSYVLSFEGAHRYSLLREHDPAAFDELRGWVAAGRWAPAGAAWEAMDCVLPSPESLIRQIHLGQRFFERHLATRCQDLFLPDCFGFPAALPTIAAHAGVVGFSTQKLRLGAQLRAAAPIPFAFGVWEGPDGQELLAALDPGGYGEPVVANLAHDESWARQFADLVEAGRPPIALRYTGIGDKGGALPDATLARLEVAVATHGPIEVVACASAQPFLEIGSDERETLPRYRGELLLAVHATGGYSSQAAIKRGNREGERTAALAESAAALASTLGSFDYPAATLRWAWKRLLAHQMHDTLCGTCIPEANALAWNDQALARARFDQVLEHALAAMARELDTRTAGAPIAVFNPLAVAVEEVVEAEFSPESAVPPCAVVRDPRGFASPVQWIDSPDGGRRALFLAKLAPLSLTVYSLEAVQGTHPAGDLTATSRGLANRHWSLHFDDAGDLVSLRRPGDPRERLGSPFRFELLRDVSERFPAWEVQHRDLAEPAAERFGGPCRFEVLEAGPVRVALAIERRSGRSTLTTRVRLAAGDAGRRIELELDLDWRSRGRLLKARLETPGGAARALYDGGVGVVERGVSTPRLYEVPAQAWAALETAAGDGIAFLTPHTSGFDHPAPSVLRATLVRTPRLGHRFTYQRDQDLGRHRTELALLPYSGSWVDGRVVEHAERLRLRPVGFVVNAHPGRLGRTATLGELVGDGVWLNAVKGLEDAPGILLRLRETRGRQTRVTFRSTVAPDRASLADGCERPLVPLAGSGGRVEVEMTAWSLASLRLELPGVPPGRGADAFAQPWPADRPVSSRDGERGGGGFDGRGRHLPTELLPATFVVDGVAFEPSRDTAGRLLAARAGGQKLQIDGGEGDLFVLGSSARGDRRVRFVVGGNPLDLVVHDWRRPLAAWDRTWRLGRLPLTLRRPGFVRRAHVGWVATHLHDRRGRNLPVVPGTLFRYRIPLPASCCRVEFPDDPHLVVVALSLGPRWLADAPHRDRRTI